MQRALRRFSRSVVISVLATFAIAPPVAAQATGTIEGRVVAAATSRPLPEVQLSVTGTTLGARTDESGRFRITGVPPGTQRVRAQRIGYNSATNSVTVVAGQAVTAEFALREAALSLEAVVVNVSVPELKHSR